MNDNTPHPGTDPSGTVYVWTVEGALRLGPLHLYATDLAHAHYCDLTVSPLQRLNVEPDGAVAVDDVDLAETSTVTDDDYAVISLTTPAGDTARYQLDLRA